MYLMRVRLLFQIIKAMTIKLRKGGWYIMDGPEVKSGPFLTFLEVYTILNNINLNRKVIR